MAPGLFSSIQSLSLKLVDAIRGSEEDLEDDLRSLSRLLRRIEAVQQDAEERQNRDRSVQLWLRELRGVAHEAEDLLDEYHYEVLASIVANGNSATAGTSGAKSKISEICTPSLLEGEEWRATNKIFTKVSIPDGMANKIKRIRERFEEISKDRVVLHLTVEDGEQQILGPKNRPPSSSHIDEKGLFGRENEKKEIISLLNPENSPRFMAVPIVGKGGLGKTMLSQLVYNDSEVRQSFDKRVWLSVSEDFDLVRLIRSTIESISKNPCTFSELSNLQEVLKEMVDGIKLFIVLDDVWNEKDSLWECFKISFIGAKTVRILLTTRSCSVAKIMQTVPPIMLGHLPEEECWMLFKHCAFGNNNANEHANLLEIGRHIVNKCNGLPLAIKVLGSLLRYETNEEKWREVLESDTWSIDERKEIIPALSLSYHHMPLHLRPCFLYLSVFPKDTRLDKELVIRLWMAQGYINPSPNKALEDIGSEYFEELRCRSLIDSVYHFCYVLHDMMHDLATSINESMYPTFKNDKILEISFPVYHFYLNGQSTLPSHGIVYNNKSVRTLLNYRPISNSYHIIFPPILKMVCLRVLELDMDIGKLPDDIGILKHLRYLKVNGSELKRLPESLCLLYNLQTLDLRNCYNFFELPIDIGNLMNLRYLSLLRQHSPIIGMPSGIRKLTNLRFIKGEFNVKGDAIYGGLGELKDLINLGGSLSIAWIKNIVDVEYAKEAYLTSKKNLHRLVLNFGKSYYKREQIHLEISPCTGPYFKSSKETEESVLDRLQPHSNIKELVIRTYGGNSFPSWIGDPLKMPKLVKLSLEYCRTQMCSFLPPLGRLPSLKSLKIRGSNIKKNGDEFCCDSPRASSIGCSKIAFPSLEELTFDNMDEWEEWFGVHDTDFPRLKNLRIDNCLRLCKLPMVPKKVEVLYIRNCGCHEVQLASQSEINYLKISGCPNLISISCTNGTLPFLKQLSVENCPKLWKFIIIPSELEQLKITNSGFHEIQFDSPSKVQNMHISHCAELTSIHCTDNAFPFITKLLIMECPNLHDLPINSKHIEILEISRCNLSEIRLLPQTKLHHVAISHCPQLTSIIGFNGENVFAKFLTDCCPLLEISVNGILQSLNGDVMIFNCPQLETTILKNIYFYMRDTVTRKYRLTGDDGIFAECSFDLVCVKKALIHPSLSSVRSQKYVVLNLPILEKLEIHNCREIISLIGLNNFGNLKHLLIWGCPKLHRWTDIPPLLEHLEVVHCDELITIPPVHKSLSLSHIRVCDCPELNEISGIYCLPSLKSLIFEDCRKLRVLPSESRLQISVENVEISHCPELRGWCQLNEISYSQTQKFSIVSIN